MTRPEVWLRGPVPDIPPLLQPVAHSLLQSREELVAMLPGLTREQLWRQPGGAASIGYHVRHAVGSLDRLLTYARGQALSAEQRTWLAAEGDPVTGPTSADELLAALEAGVTRALQQLRGTDEATLLEARAVGRAGLPSTVAGLLFHAAEHTHRHAGQIATTAKVVSAG